VIRSGTLLTVLVLAVATACGDKKEEGEKEAAAKACGPAPAAATAKPKLPPKFPTPSEVTYTGEKAAGPSSIVSGYWRGDVDEAFDGYKSAFDGAGYDVTKDEHEEVDAEVNFSGGSSTGQVKLLQTCKDRTTVTITIRPS
jgi:hypothetical protein